MSESRAKPESRSFLDRVAEVRQPDYAPTDQDILRSRKTTTEIQKIEFSVRIAAKYGGGHLSFWSVTLAC